MRGLEQPARDGQKRAGADQPSKRDTYRSGAAFWAAIFAAFLCLIAATVPPRPASHEAENHDSYQTPAREVIFDMSADAQEAKPLTAPLRSLVDGRRWLNTSPLGAGDLRSKVVLV